MDNTRVVASLLIVVFALAALGGGHKTGAQHVEVEVGSGWALPSSSVDMTGTVQGSGESGRVPVDPGSGLHAYASIGLTWTISSNFALAARVRAQESRMPGDAGDLTSRLQGCGEGECVVSNDPDGRLRAASFEGQITLTSTGRIKPYFLVGLGVVRTTIDGTRVEIPGEEETEDVVVDFSEVAVTDAGGDVGFGAVTRLVGGLSATAEVRATGSLPGGKENAVTVFPFSLGLSYEF